MSVADLQRELTRFPGAEFVESDLPPAAVTAVQNALAEANRTPFTDAPVSYPPAGGGASPAAGSPPPAAV